MFSKFSRMSWCQQKILNFVRESWFIFNLWKNKHQSMTWKSGCTGINNLEHRRSIVSNSCQPFLTQLCNHKLCTYLNSYLLGAPREYIHHGLVLGLDWTFGQLSSTCIFLVCPGPPSILLFVPTIHVSHMHPPMPTGRLNTCTQVNNMAMLHHIFPIYFYGFSCICTSAAPQRPAHSTVSSQVATHLRTDRVCCVLGRSWIWTQDYWFAVRCATIEPPLLLIEPSLLLWATPPPYLYMVTHIFITFILLSIPPLYCYHSFGQVGWPRPFFSVTVLNQQKCMNNVQFSKALHLTVYTMYCDSSSGCYIYKFSTPIIFLK